MGNLFCGEKPKKLSVEQQQLQQRLQQQQQQQLQQQYGVLIPPIFTVSQYDGYVTLKKDCMPISTQAQWYAAVSSPNLVENLWRLTAGYNLLTEYMAPGIYFAGRW
jgi:type II secretory pathway pseudopilin PulG